MVEYQDNRRDAPNVPFAMRYTVPVVSPYHGLVRELLSRWPSETTAPVIGLTSAAHRSGVTTIAANLGVSAAEIANRPILLIDCNANSPHLLNVFGAPASSGINEIVYGEQTLSDCVFPTRVHNLCVLGPGVASRQSKNTNEEHAWCKLLQDAARGCGLVIVDLPPVPELLSEVMSLQGIDRLLLVVEAERTRRQAVARAKGQLSRVGVELSGIVLNKRRKHIPGWIYRRI